MRVRGIFNPAAVRLGNGKILLLARVAETPKHGERYFIAPKMTGKPEKPAMCMERIPKKQGVLEKHKFLTRWGMWRLPTISHFRRAILDSTGMAVEKLSQRPDFCGCGGDGDFGVEDPKLVFFKKQRMYAMTYVSVSQMSGVSTSLALSKNLSKWKRVGIVFRQQNKDVVLFPEKIGGYYVALNRPEGLMIFDKPSIWVSYSKEDRPLLFPRETGWDSLRIGAGTVPVRTSEGFLEIYHGVGRSKNRQKVYRAGAILFDLKNPEKILAQTPTTEPLFGPSAGFEKKGFVDNVVFPTGSVLTMDKKQLLVYSGGADSCITVRKIPIKKILNSMEFYAPH
jgi:predicted GH43/DUF377 family glycosyl hydrolase